MSAVTALNCPACDGEGAVMGVECATCKGTGEVETLSPMAQAAQDDMAALAQVPPWDGTERRALVPAAPADEVTAALAEVTKTNATITSHLNTARELGEKYRGVAFSVRTVKGMDDACKARASIREQRYGIQKLQEAGSKMMGSMQRQFNARAKAVIAEVEGFEQPIHEQITAEEARKEVERKEREEAESRRRQAHIDAITAIGRHVIEGSGEDSAELVQRIAGVTAILIDESYEEFQGQAQQAKDEALRQLNGMLVAARAEEAELEETRRQQAALKAAQAALKAEQEAQAARVAEQQREQEAAAALFAKEKAEFERAKAALDEQIAQQERAVQERRNAVQYRIEYLSQAIDNPPTGFTSKQLAEAIDNMRAAVISADLYDDRVSEAKQAKNDALDTLGGLLLESQRREAEEARQQQAARIRELINDIRIAGEKAALAVEDGSAELKGLRAGLEEIRTTAFGGDTFGDHTTEAIEVARGAAVKIEAAITATEERDRLAAEEAERQRQILEEGVAAHALVDAKRAHGEELYELLRSAVIYGSHPEWMDGARALLLSINPEETFE